MEMKKYEEVLGKNDLLQNQMALTILIDNGRDNFLTEGFVENWTKNMKGNSMMTREFQIRLVEIAKDMAQLSQSELYRFIKKEVRIPEVHKKSKKDRDR